MEGATSDRLFSVNVPRVRESLNALADDIEFIASDNADGPSDYDAWEHRVNAGRQLVRLRAALNNGDLDRADCALPTLELLRRSWHAIKALKYGSHHDQPDQYCGPLHLPGEIQPLYPLSRESLRLRKADEPYDPFPELTNTAKRMVAECNDTVLATGIQQLIDRRTTTKRKEWAGLPDELRTLSNRLVEAKGMSETPYPNNVAELVERIDATLAEINGPNAEWTNAEWWGDVWEITKSHCDRVGVPEAVADRSRIVAEGQYIPDVTSPAARAIRERLRKRLVDLRLQLTGKSVAKNDNADEASDSPTPAKRQSVGEDQSAATGFLGGAELADALGVHSTRRDAFFQELGRKRIGLGDSCWHEVREPRPNSPRFLYRVNSQNLRALASDYRNPKLD